MKFRLFVVMVLLIAFAVGCSSTSGSNSGSEASGSGTPSKNNEAVSNGDKEVELTFFYPVGVGGPLAKLIEDQTQEFMKEYPNIKLNPVFSGNSAETMTKTITAIQGGTPPDFAILPNSELYTFLSMNAIAPLDDFIAKDGGSAYIEDFLPALMANSVYDNKIWSIPFQRSTVVAFYNKDHFREAGLDPDSPPKDWNELAEAATKLTKKDSNGNVSQWGIMIPLDDPFAFMGFGMQNSANGENLMTEDGKKALFNTPENVEALQFTVDLSKKYGAMPEGPIKWETAPANFIEGKASIIYTSTGNLANIMKNADFEVGTAFLPQGKRYGSPTGGANLFIFKSSPPEHQEAAWKFIRWITEPARTAQWNIDTGYIATRNSAYELDIMKNYYAEVPQAKVARDQLDYAGSEIRLYDNGSNLKIIKDAIAAALTGTKTPEKALEDAQAQSDKVLEPFNK